MTIGADLRTARESKGLSLDTIAQRTRVQTRALAAIEQNDASALPPRPFGRGFVRAYAVEVGLDPDRTVRDYFAQFPPAEPNVAAVSTSRHEAEDGYEISSQWSGLATAVGILALVVITAVLMSRRTETTRERDAVGAVGTSGAVHAVARPTDSKGAATPTAARGAVEAPRPAPAPAVPLTLAFTVSRPCWVAATADGQRTIYRMVDTGERQTVTASKEIAIRFGDAGAVTWTINGRQGSALGDTGVVRDLRITPENVTSVR